MKKNIYGNINIFMIKKYHYHIWYKRSLGSLQYFLTYKNKICIFLKIITIKSCKIF